MSNSLLVCMNLLPIGTYFCVLGFLHASSRPLVTTSVRDFLALAVALAGPVINGPLDYALHSRLLPDYVPHGWWMGLGIYLIVVGALMPRSHETLISYNASAAAVAQATRAVFQRMGVRFQEVPCGWMLTIL